MRSLRLVAAPAVLCLGLLAGCGGDSDTGTETDAGSDSGAATTGECTWETSQRPAAAEVEPPAEDAEPITEPLVISTSAGDIPVELDPEALCATTSFSWLAEQGYFDDSPCSRVSTTDVPYGILQCGDPTGTGTGGPGYEFADELTGDEAYPAGTLAMANAGPNTNGSQFFLTYADSAFPPDYTVFGTIDPAGVAVLEDIAAAGTETGEPDGAPAEPVVIESVRPAE